MPGDAERAAPEPDTVECDDRLVEAARIGLLHQDAADPLVRVLAGLHDRARRACDQRPAL